MKYFFEKTKKCILHNNTQSIPFMLGLFVGVSLFNADLVYNSIVTLVSGSMFHVIKALFDIKSV